MTRARFPHLLPADCDLWERFLDENPKRFSHIDYDVRVGFGRDPGHSFDSNLRQMAIDLSQRRIDAVGHSDGVLHIIEIATVPGLRALGQLIAYPTLYQQTFSPTQSLVPLLIAEVLQADIRPVLIANHLMYELYPPPIGHNDRPKDG